MKPAFRIVANEQDITDNLRDRLLELEVTDEAELKSDEVRITLDYRPRDGAYVVLPAVGTKLEVFMGFEGQQLALMGRYTIDQIKLTGGPLTLEVTGRAAAMTTPFRSPKSREWHDTTLGAIVETLAQENGYTPRLDAQLAAVPIPHEDQTAESDMAFLTRITDRLDAVAKPAAGFLILAPRGETKAFNGTPLPRVTLRETATSKWTFEHNARDDAGQAGALGGVETVYWDTEQAKMEKVASGSPPYTNVRFITANRGEAGGIATSTQNKADRKKKQFSATVMGNSALMAEARLTLKEFPPGMDLDWVLTSVKHRLSDNGYLCEIEAEVYQPKQADPANVTTFTS